MLSRRRLITTGTAVGALSVLSPGLLRGSQATQSAGSVTDYISIRMPSDEGFVRHLDQLFPGLRSDNVFQQIQSHAVLVTNISQNPIRAFSTHWAATTATGGYETLIRHFFHPSSRTPKTVHFGLKGNKTRFTGAVAVLKPGRTRLLTPYFSWSPNFYSRKSNVKLAGILSASASREFCLNEFSKLLSLNVVVDAVVINHTTVIGPDLSNLARVFRVTRNAEHDEANAVLKFVRSGNGEVADFLLQHAAVEVPVTSDAFHDLYLTVKKRQAKVLSRRFAKATPQQFVNTLEYLKNKPKTTTGIGCVRVKGAEK